LYVISSVIGEANSGGKSSRTRRANNVMYGIIENIDACIVDQNTWAVIISLLAPNIVYKIIENISAVACWNTNSGSVSIIIVYIMNDALCNIRCNA